MTHKHHYEYDFDPNDRSRDVLICTAESVCTAKWPSADDLNRWVEIDEAATELVSVCESQAGDSFGNVDRVYKKLRSLVGENENVGKPG